VKNIAMTLISHRAGVVEADAMVLVDRFVSHGCHVDASKLLAGNASFVLAGNSPKCFGGCFGGNTDAAQRMNLSASALA
jgi:hypothetical protein